MKTEYIEKRDKWAEENNQPNTAFAAEMSVPHNWDGNPIPFIEAGGFLPISSKSKVLWEFNMKMVHFGEQNPDAPAAVKMLPTDWGFRFRAVLWDRKREKAKEIRRLGIRFHRDAGPKVIADALEAFAARVRVFSDELMNRPSGA